MLSLLLVLGGFGTRREVDNQQLISFIQRFGPSSAASQAADPNLLTICTGSALAARAGLLDGRCRPPYSVPGLGRYCEGSSLSLSMSNEPDAKDCQSMAWSEVPMV